MMSMCTNTEPTTWEPEELDDTTLELPGHYQRENHGTSLHLSRSTQTVRMSPTETNSYTSALPAEASSQSFTSDWPEIANEMMHVSPATCAANDEKEVVRGRKLSRDKGQMLFTPPRHFPFSLDDMITQSQTAAALVNGLAQVFHRQNDGMTNILGGILHPSEIDACFATPSFTTGIKALQRYYGGFVPGTLREIFSLVRIAYAAACLLHHGESSFPWHHFIQDVVRWNENIADPEETRLFLRTIDALHSSYHKPEGSSHSRMTCVCSFWIVSPEVSS